LSSEIFIISNQKNKTPEKSGVRQQSEAKSGVRQQSEAMPQGMAFGFWEGS